MPTVRQAMMKRRVALARGRRARAARGRVGRKVAQSNVHYYKRSYYLAATVTNTGVSSGYGYSFSLAAVPNASDFTLLYDQYKILGVKFKLLPRGNSSDVGAQNNLGSLFSVIDRDDATAPTTINTLMQYQNMKQTRSSQIHTRVFRPTYTVGTLDSAGLVLGKQISKGWLDCNTAATPHFGLKLWNEVSSAATVTYDAIVTVSLAFKNVR